MAAGLAFADKHEIRAGGKALHQVTHLLACSFHCTAGIQFGPQHQPSPCTLDSLEQLDWREFHEQCLACSHKGAHTMHNAKDCAGLRCTTSALLPGGSTQMLTAIRNHSRPSDWPEKEGAGIRRREIKEVGVLNLGGLWA